MDNLWLSPAVPLWPTREPRTPVWEPLGQYYSAHPVLRSADVCQELTMTSLFKPEYIPAQQLPKLKLTYLNKFFIIKFIVVRL